MRLLTQEILRKDRPLFEFVIRDKPYPINNYYWPDRSEVAPYCFLEFGEFIMDELFAVFKINGKFDPYDLTNYYLATELDTLTNNIETEINNLLQLNQESFLNKFGGASFIYILDVDTFEEARSQWEDLRADIIEILLLIKEKAGFALQEEKNLAIVGI